MFWKQTGGLVTFSAPAIPAILASDSMIVSLLRNANSGSWDTTGELISLESVPFEKLAIVFSVSLKSLERC